jgi:hypothetical protein
MQLDPRNWSPLTVAQAAAEMRGFPARWWIAGGWALELFLAQVAPSPSGEPRRVHEDTDVLILRRDQLAAQQHLSHWRLFKTQQPKPPHLAPWPEGEFLGPPINDVWLRDELHEGPWRFQLMLMEAEGERWVYRRKPTIGGPLAELGLTTPEGLPYLAPEIQLLYKSRTGRPKDEQDFQAVHPHLAQTRRHWLLTSLREQYPEGHPWAEVLAHS